VVRAQRGSGRVQFAVLTQQQITTEKQFQNLNRSGRRSPLTLGTALNDSLLLPAANRLGTEDDEKKSSKI
jgi:hypothetical protein